MLSGLMAVKRVWFYPDLTDTSLRVIIHLEMDYATAKKVHYDKQTSL